MMKPFRNCFSRLCGRIVILSALLLSGCAPARSRSVRIGLALYDAHDAFISELAARFQSNVLATEGEIQLETYDAAGSQYIQNSQVEQLIESGCSVICVNPADRTAPGRIIETAKKNDVPLIFFNREPVEEDLKQWKHLYYIGSPSENSGTLQGEIAAAYLSAHPEADKNGDGVIQYYILEGEPGHQDAIIRSEESVDAITDAGFQLERIGYAIANWSELQAQTKISEVLQEHIELILSNNDAMAAGAVSAYEKAGIPRAERPVIFGFDGTAAGLNMMKDHQIAGTVYNNGKEVADQMFRLAEALIKKENLRPFSLQSGRYLWIPYEKITEDNLGDYLNE